MTIKEYQEYFYIKPVPPKIAIYSTDNILIGEYPTYYKAEKELKLPMRCIR